MGIAKDKNTIDYTRRSGHLFLNTPDPFLDCTDLQFHKISLFDI
jgi:hypothetical protein